MTTKHVVIRAQPFAYWAVVLMIFASAAWLRARNPLEPLADPDTWGYLGPALHKMLGDGLVHEGRNFVYPGFIFLLLRCFGDFRAITVAQHLLGLAAGGMFLLTWREVCRFLPPEHERAIVHRWLGLIGAAIYLFALKAMRFEGDIRPEGICSFVAIVQIFCALRFVRLGFRRRQKRRFSIGLGVSTVVSSASLVFIRPSLGLVGLVTLLPIGVAVLWDRDRRGLISFSIGVRITTACLLVPEYLMRRGDKTRVSFLPTDLFMIHAAIIRDQMNEDLVNNVSLPFRREWLQRVHASLSMEIKKSAQYNGRNYPALGFDPDFLTYRHGSTNSQLRAEFHNKIDELCDFYRYWYRRVWRTRPLRMVAKIGEQMLIFYRPTCPAYRGQGRWGTHEDFVQSARVLESPQHQAVVNAYKPALDSVARTREGLSAAPVIKQEKLEGHLLHAASRTYLLIAVASIVASVLVLMSAHLRPRWGWFAALVMFLYCYNFAACLEVAVVHTLDVVRYSAAQLIFTLLAQFAAALLLIELAIGYLMLRVGSSRQRP